MPRIAALICVLATAASAAAAIVYDNSRHPTGGVNALLIDGQINSTEHGNQITLEGTERTVTNIRVFLETLEPAVSAFDMQVRFYRNDGPGGMPGPLIWQSALQAEVIDFGVPIGYSVAVPNIVVPNEFTWTVQLTNRRVNTNGVTGPAQFDPPAVGSAAAGFWQRTGPGATDWIIGNIGEAHFGAIVNAEAGDCDSPLSGDLNGDGAADGKDIKLFVEALLAHSQDAADLCAADFDSSGEIDLGDTAGMASLLVGD